MAAVFIPEGDLFVPTELAGGPWDPGRAMHGGAPAALMARAIEAVPLDTPMDICRLTVEFLRPVPMRPLSVTARITRPGRKVQLIESSIQDDGQEVARATALRIRTTDVPGGPFPREAAPPPPEDGFDPEVSWIGFGKAMEIRVVGGDLLSSGPATIWFRLRQPIVEGEEPSALMRVAAAADFGNGISWVVPWTTHLFINPDLTVYLARRPEGEWICLDARSEISEGGTGVTTSAVHDRAGRVGTSAQALLVDSR